MTSSKKGRLPLWICAAVSIAFLAPSAHAGSDESIVYGDELTKPRETSFELYEKFAKTSKAGSLRGDGEFHVIGEFGYGLSRQWDVALKVPFTHVGGSWYGNGAFAEVKYIAPHAVEGLYWGVEIEAGSIKAFRAERAWVIEAVPIIGYRSGRFHFIANPGLEYTPEENDRGLSFEPKFKAAYQYNHQNAFGLEYHIDAGLLRKITSRPQRNEVAYLTWDATVDERHISVGIGRGTTAVSDRWAAKIMIDLDD